MSKGNFVHLHLHSDYSLLDGACKIEDIIKETLRLDMPAVALTDHGALYGAVEFYKAATSAGIKPIIGCEVYTATRTRHDRNPQLDSSQHHFLLLCKNNIGYKNLLKIVSCGHLEGFYYKPRVDREILSQYSEGLIALSACIKGEIPTLISQKNLKKARELSQYFKEVYKENFYLELQEQGLPEQKEINSVLISLSRELKIPLVASNDVHYIRREHSTSHDVLLCIQTNKKVKDADRLRFGSQEFYFKTPLEMQGLFPTLPSAIENSLFIAEQCKVVVDTSALHLPEYKLEKGTTSEVLLREKVEDGVKIRYGKATPQIRERLDFELQVIIQKGLASYFLIIWDIIDFAKKNGIFVGPGRGSAAGSLVSYCLGITNIDPLRYGLLFERFLNSDRRSLPDIDTDFSDEGRDRIIAYITEKYGKENVAQVITYGVMKESQALRDAGRALDLPYQEVDRIAKTISQCIRDAREKEESKNITFKDAKEVIPEVKELYAKSEEMKTLLDTAISIEGLHRHASVHAAGVVITPLPLVEYLPLQLSEHNFVTTQYSMKEIEDIGLLKMDILGLKNLTIISETLKTLEKEGIKLDIEKMDFDDEGVYKMLASGESIGVFQLESQGMRNILIKMKPTKFEDLIAVLALYRPGPLRSGMVDDFIKRKDGTIEVKYLHPALQSILKETYGIIVYQEQVMQIARDIAGMTSSQAEDIRRAMGKKVPETLGKLKEAFVKGCVNNKIPRKTANKIFELMDHFGGYGFNKSHSVAYAATTYYTAYLKKYHPLPYFISILNAHKDDKDTIGVQIQAVRDMGINILPPDINLSQVDFAREGTSIRVGLSAVKNVGKAAREIEAVRKGGYFKSILDFCSRVDGRLVNKKVIESLIKCGAFSSLGSNRATLLTGMDKIMEQGGSALKEKQTGQVPLFFVEDTPTLSLSLENIEEFPPETLLSFEKELLGFYYSSNPLEDIKETLKVETQSIASLHNLPEESEVRVYGVIGNISRKFDRSKNQMAYFILEGLEGKIEVIVFSEVWKKFKDNIIKDSIAQVRGRINKKETITEGGEEKEEIKLIAEEIIPFSSGNLLNNRALHLKINHINATPFILEEVKNILSEGKGGVPGYPSEGGVPGYPSKGWVGRMGRRRMGRAVYLHLQDKVLKLPEEFNVGGGEETVGKLRHLLSPSNVWWE